MLQERGSEKMRLLDRVFGVPLIWFLGVFRRRHVRAPASPRSIGILISAAIGDTIVFSAILDEIKAQYPESEVTLFVGNSNRAVLALLKGVDRAVVLPVKHPLRALKVLRAEKKFDLWIDAGQWARINALYSWAVAADFKIGFQTPGQGRHWIYDAPILHRSDVHELVNFRSLLFPLGLRTSRDPHIEVSATQNSRLIVIHMFAGGAHPHLKEWPASYWVDVINALTEQKFLIALSGVADDRDAAEQVRQNVRAPEQVENVAGKLSLEETARLLKSSVCVVSVNTGILHLSAALGCFVVGLQGPTSVQRWGPIGSSNVGLQSPLHCSPCLNLGFDYGCGENKCMVALKPQAVLDVLSRVTGLKSANL